MNFLKKLLGGSSGSVKDYDYYVVQKRQGGIYGKWESIEELPDFLDSATGVATYGDGMDATLRCLGVKKFGDREIKKQLWQHISREDVEEEIEERKKRVGKKDGDNIDRYFDILKLAKDEERERIESQLGMMSEFYQTQYELFSNLSQQNSEANKYDVWREGIHEMGEIGKEIIQELREGREGSGDKDEKETEKFEDYKRRALPPGRTEGKNKCGGSGKPGAALMLMAKYIEGSGDPVSYLETIAVAFPDVYQALLTVKNLEELLEKLKPHAKKLPVLATEEAKEWLARMLEIISQVKAESNKSAPGAEIKTETENQETEKA